ALREHPKARALSDLAEEGGAWTVALLRLAPILPFTPTNAVLGLTGMRLRDLALGTFLGMAPGALLYAWAGSLVPSAEALEEGESLVPGPLVWGLLAASIVAAVVIGIAAARRLRRATPEGRPPR
ncbi:MAG: VTT domain-containing protein, partial [Deltaproteobacteria bacterium]